jgi:circadian clock protein KaiB
MTALPDAAAPDTTGSAAYDLTLFVSGASGLSARAIDDVRLLCDAHLRAGVHLTVIDVHSEPKAALGHGVTVVPTLVRTRPLPVRRIVGDLSQTERVLSMLLVEDAATAPRD